MLLTTTRFIFFIALIAGFTSCNGSGITDTVSTPTPTISDEISFCSSEISYSPGVVVSGTAKFRRRGVNFALTSGVATSATIGAVISTLLPIKYAEIRVLNSNGDIIQCGTTNELGELKALNGTSALFLPNDAGNFTFQVFARANYTFASAGKPSSATLSTAVKEDIYSNEVYKVTGTLSSSGFGGTPNSAINLIAQAQESLSSKIEGGAFNIYNNWVTAFEYLTSTANTSNLDVSCLNQRLDMYWKAGFNPALYIDPDVNPSSTLSFYLRDDKELYICGGSVGNVYSADTDHWDDAVIQHEMGHHIENVCGTMDSPGGQHSAQYRIDPRLAWSEAWGNFMGGHIVKNNVSKINPHLTSALPNGEWMFYSDTAGYNDGTTTGTSMIFLRLNKPGNGTTPGRNYDIVSTTNVGESHVREGSIARGLFKSVNTCAANCGGGITFDKFWTALGTTTSGMGHSSTPFSSSAKFFAKVFAANGNTFPSSMTIITTADESLHMVGSASYTVTASTSSTGTVATNAWPGYGIKLTTSSACNATPMLLQPRNTSNTSSHDSDQRYTNHFYTIRKSDLSGVTAIRLVPDSTCHIDIDLLVMTSDYVYNEDCAAYNTAGTSCTSVAKTISDSVTTYSRTTASMTASTNAESITMSALGSGYYLLNVRGYSAYPTVIPSTTQCAYRLKDQNGATLCPSTSY